MTAAALALGDYYGSLAWGGKLGKASEATVAAGVLDGSDCGLTDQEKTMAAWARKAARDPNATTPADIQALRDSGRDDGQIFAITAFVALRLAFSVINDSLGAQPDAQLAQSLPPRGARGRDLRPARSYLSAGAVPWHLGEHICGLPIPSGTVAIFNPDLPPATQPARMTCRTG